MGALQDMDADALRGAITKEMQDYQRPKPPTLYVLRPVTTTSHNKDDLSSSGTCQPANDSAVNSTSYSQSRPLESATDTDVVKDTNSADAKPKLKMPGISTPEIDVDRNSVDMPSANACHQFDDIAMLSAESGGDGDAKLTKEICRDTNSNNGNLTVSTSVRDYQTDSAAVKDDFVSASVNVNTQSSSNSLVVSTEVPQAADAKARIKAALLNSGWRRQRLG